MTGATGTRPGLVDEVVARLIAALCRVAGLEAAGREPIRRWRLSGVDRLHPAGGGPTVIVKYATGIGTTEDRVLRRLDGLGVPVPRLLASTTVDGTLGMLIEDLGDPVRPATEIDAARAAVRLHTVGPVHGLPLWTETRLAELPARMLATLHELYGDGRLPGSGDLLTVLGELADIAGPRAAGAQRAPFGLCHSELHPTSLHIGRRGWRLLDVAHAFNGPGLLDLATWYGTRRPPDPTRLGRFVEQYVAVGGNREALADRGGLPAVRWALGWHRIWSAGWLLACVQRGADPTGSDEQTVAILRRQLQTGVALLGA